jgi:hypothetical protein
MGTSCYLVRGELAQQIRFGPESHGAGAGGSGHDRGDGPVRSRGDDQAVPPAWLFMAALGVAEVTRWTAPRITRRREGSTSPRLTARTRRPRDGVRTSFYVPPDETGMEEPCSQAAWSRGDLGWRPPLISCRDSEYLSAQSHPPTRLRASSAVLTKAGNQLRCHRASRGRPC